jgi:putative ABC transport system permease protein
VIRLALRMLTRDTTKWLGVLLGIILSTFLITHMLSLFTGMMERSYALVSDIPQADIWVMDPAVEYCDEPMPDTALERVRGVAGVAWAVPLHSGSLRARLPTGDFRSVAIIGIDDATLVGAPARVVEGDVFSLRQADAAILDAASAHSTLRVPVDITRHWSHEGHQPDPGVLRDLAVGDDLLVNDRRVMIVGLADLGPRFLTKPVLYTTYSRAIQISPSQRHMLSFVLAKAAPGHDPANLAREISLRTGLRARTTREFADDTYWYYVKYTGVVSRIGLMVGIGVVTGVCVSALLLYLFHQRERPVLRDVQGPGHHQRHHCPHGHRPGRHRRRRRLRHRRRVQHPHWRTLPRARHALSTPMVDPRRQRQCHDPGLLHRRCRQPAGRAQTRAGRRV